MTACCATKPRLTAKVSPRSVEVLERVTFSVRNGELTSVPFRVPAEFADRWELLDRQEVDAFELSREADGSRRYRLAFNRAGGRQEDVCGFAIAYRSIEDLMPPPRAS